MSNFTSISHTTCANVYPRLRAALADCKEWQAYFLLQFLNRSIANSANVVNTLAAFGLAYVIIKFFVGVLEEVKQVGVVLVHDRPGFHKILACVIAMGTVVFFLSIIIG